MTTLSAPDFYVEMEISPEDFQQTSGIIWDALVDVGPGRSKCKALFLIPRGNTSPEVGMGVEGWVWVDDALAPARGSRVGIVLVRVHDLNVTAAQAQSVQVYQGRVYSATVALVHCSGSDN